MKEVLERARENIERGLTFLECAESEAEQADRIIKLVQDHDALFGDAPAGTFRLEQAADKLEALIEHIETCDNPQCCVCLVFDVHVDRFVIPGPSTVFPMRSG
jgi:hypothetical protein